VTVGTEKTNLRWNATKGLQAPQRSADGKAEEGGRRGFQTRKLKTFIIKKVDVAAELKREGEKAKNAKTSFITDIKNLNCLGGPREDRTNSNGTRNLLGKNFKRGGQEEVSAQKKKRRGYDASIC